MVAVNVHYTVGLAVMLLGTAVFVRAFVTDARNRTYHAILVGIAGIAAGAYVFMLLGIGFLTVEGNVVNLAKYGQWLLATPLLILYLGLLAGLDRGRIGLLIVLDVVVMGSGLVGELLAGPALTYGSFAVGSVAYIALIYMLTAGIREAVTDRPGAIVALFGKLRNLTLIIWTIYPVIWILSPAGLGVLEPTMQALLYTYADLIAKILFGAIALNSQTSLEQLPELDALSGFGVGPN
ncbi:bacteriorhodopsin [Natrinema longum]|uniref:Bacteriorhodopsin n=1 Tax=Natrinema longum TaxID=370324 RepID=A0A8A2U5A2_9EURY|nr:bacteriorhodopsin [Natrinema longum]MBZ6494601.1 bacteriorhodopsin [Natrinema longum]QSW84079.1 bacteriorhodopsin [Natrinema longum]